MSKRKFGNVTFGVTSVSSRVGRPGDLDGHTAPSVASISAVFIDQVGDAVPLLMVWHARTGRTSSPLR
jgi:hypothetical protein